MEVNGMQNWMTCVDGSVGFPNLMGWYRHLQASNTLACHQIRSGYFPITDWCANTNQTNQVCIVTAKQLTEVQWVASTIGRTDSIGVFQCMTWPVQENKQHPLRLVYRESSKSWSNVLHRWLGAPFQEGWASSHVGLYMFKSCCCQITFHWKTNVLFNFSSAVFGLMIYNDIYIY